MSMGMGLHGVRDWLRTQFGWKENQCGVQYQCLPPATADQFYVAIDDAGVEVGPDETDALTEILNIEIGVWRRPGGKPADRLGMLKLPQDIYLAGIYTNTDLERMVLCPTGAAKNKGGLHKNYGFLTFVNTLFGLPDDDLGAAFMDPLNFRGFSRFESIAIPGQSTDPDVFYGRRLRFRGLKRIQKVRELIG
jgi:hypothetical protein